MFFIICIEIQVKYEKKVDLWQKELDNIKLNETSEEKDSGNNHMTTLIRDHEAVLSELSTLTKDMEQDLDINLSLKV